VKIGEPTPTNIAGVIMFQNKIKLCSDCPIEVLQGDPFKNDMLKLQESVRNVATLIQQVETPFTLGVYGAWGSGKTSFMKMLEAVLKGGSSNCHTYWFEAWKYENELTLMLPLLSEMYDKLTDRKLKDSLKKIGIVSAVSLADLALKGLTSNAINSKEIVKNFRMYEKEMGEIYKYWKSATKENVKGFEAIVEAYTSGKGPLVVFIDDLDRCMPDMVVKMLESIKHFFAVKRCIFVIGVDKGVLSKAINAKYGDLIDGNEYLEKIVNLAYELPLEVDKNIKDFILEAAESMTTPEWYKAIKGKIHQAAELLAISGVKHVPRRIRLLIQRVLFYLAMKDEGEVLDIKSMTTLLILKEFFPHLYGTCKSSGYLQYYPDGNSRASLSATASKAVLGDRDEICKAQYGHLKTSIDNLASRINSYPVQFQTLFKEAEFLYSLH
jgi:hypothetical protein